jgi:cytochrome c peroxidase
VNNKWCKVAVLIIALFAGIGLLPTWSSSAHDQERDEEIESALNQELRDLLNDHGFTGRIEEKLRKKLGRKIDNQLANLGGLTFHDSLLGLNNDNSCAGCHAAPLGFGDSQSIAIGVNNNNIVGPNRTGPRNQRRAPLVINNVFYPRLMWNSRFESLANDPFDNSAGFKFPPPEGFSLSFLPHLLTAQAFIPTTERPEMAGFGPHVPPTNDGIRAEVVARLNSTPAYVELFGKNFQEVKDGAPITYELLAKAIAEFEFSITFADATIDKFARGQKNAMTANQKRGAILFFGTAGCVNCHAVSGISNEMFSDFKQHVAGVPQIVPAVGNVPFDGPGANEDFGLEQITGNSNDRYAFRSSPLRNIVLQPTFFHNGAFTKLEDAVRFHLNALQEAPKYKPAKAGVDKDLQGPMGPLSPVLARIDPLLIPPVNLTEAQFNWVVDFLRNGLHDPRATPDKLRKLLPKQLPSGRPVHVFE